jgi:hypothetical protein
VFHADIMPLSWIHDLPRQQVEELAVQLGLPTDGTLDDLRRKVKERWSAIEPYLPSQSTAKSAFTNISASQSRDPPMNRGNSWEKMKVKLASDLIADIPVLSSTDPEYILNILIRVKHVPENESCI